MAKAWLATISAIEAARPVATASVRRPVRRDWYIWVPLLVEPQTYSLWVGSMRGCRVPATAGSPTTYRRTYCPQDATLGCAVLPGTALPKCNDPGPPRPRDPACRDLRPASPGTRPRPASPDTTPACLAARSFRHQRTAGARQGCLTPLTEPQTDRFAGDPVQEPCPTAHAKAGIAADLPDDVR